MKKFLSLILTFAIIATLSGCGSSATYKIGVCEFTEHTAQSEVIRGFTEYLTDKLGDEVSFDVKNAAGDANTATLIVNDFITKSVDLILADNTQSLQVASSATGSIPVLGAAITDYNVALESIPTGTNISGTSDLAPLDGQASMIIELFPEAKNVGLIYCSSEVNSLYQINAVQEFLSNEGISTREFAFVDANDLSSAVMAACEYSDVIYVPTDNTIASCAGIVDSVCREAKVPVISGEKGICSDCGIATLSIDYYELGKQTGMMAYRILAESADISQIPIEYPQTFTKMYNPEIAEDLGIVIPEDYIAIE